MYSSISHQLHALMLEYWARNMGGVLIFLISHFVLFYFQKHPVKKWERQKESLKVSKPVTLLINAEICLKIQEAKFEVYCPNQAEHGWEAIWSGVTGAIPWDCLSDFLPNMLVVSLSLPFLSKPCDAHFSRALQDQGRRDLTLHTSREWDYKGRPRVCCEQIPSRMWAMKRNARAMSLCKLRNNKSIKTHLGLPSEIVKFWYT